MEHHCGRCFDNSVPLVVSGNWISRPDSANSSDSDFRAKCLSGESCAISFLINAPEAQAQERLVCDVDTKIAQCKSMLLLDETTGNSVPSIRLNVKPTYAETNTFSAFSFHGAGLAPSLSRPSGNQIPVTRPSVSPACTERPRSVVPMPMSRPASWMYAPDPLGHELDVSVAPPRPDDGRFPSTSGQSSRRFSAESGIGRATTLMLRHVPRKCTQQLFVRELDVAGFAGRYDFVYLPVSTWTLKNKGFAFVNFDLPETSESFYRLFNNGKLRQFHSTTPLLVQPADLQGFEANARMHFHASSSSSSQLNVPLFLRPLPPHIIGDGCQTGWKTLQVAHLAQSLGLP